MLQLGGGSSGGEKWLDSSRCQVPHARHAQWERDHLARQQREHEREHGEPRLQAERAALRHGLGVGLESGWILGQAHSSDVLGHILEHLVRPDELRRLDWP